MAAFRDTSRPCTTPHRRRARLRQALERTHDHGAKLCTFDLLELRRIHKTRQCLLSPRKHSRVATARGGKWEAVQVGFDSSSA